MFFWGKLNAMLASLTAYVPAHSDLGSALAFCLQLGSVQLTPAEQIWRVQTTAKP